MTRTEAQAEIDRIAEELLKLHELGFTGAIEINFKSGEPRSGHARDSHGPEDGWNFSRELVQLTPG